MIFLCKKLIPFFSELASIASSVKSFGTELPFQPWPVLSNVLVNNLRHPSIRLFEFAVLLVCVRPLFDLRFIRLLKLCEQWVLLFDQAHQFVRLDVQFFNLCVPGVDIFFLRLQLLLKGADSLVQLSVDHILLRNLEAHFVKFTSNYLVYVPLLSPLFLQ